MAQISLSERFAKRRRIRLATIIAGLFVTAILVQLVVLDKPQVTEAAVRMNYGGSGNVEIFGSDSRLDYRNYVVDKNGVIYAIPNPDIISGVDIRHYSYLAQPIVCDDYSTTPPSRVSPCNIAGLDKNLTITGATVIMEGEQNFGNITVKDNGRITQPYADAEGKLNRPMYTKGYWGAEFEGYLFLPSNSQCAWLHFAPTNILPSNMPYEADRISEQSSDPAVDDAVQIQVYQDRWWTVYRRSNNPAAYGSNVNTTFGQVGTPVDMCNSSGSQKVLQFRARFVNTTGSANLSLFQTNLRNVAGTNNWYIRSHDYLLSSQYSTDSSNVNGKLKFAYYLNRGFNLQSLNFNDDYRKTAEKAEMDVGVDLAGARYGIYYPNESNKFRLTYGANNAAGALQDATPLGDSRTEINAPTRYVSSRHGNWPLNYHAFDLPGGTAERRIYSGLTLNVAGTVTLDGGGGPSQPLIDLNGVGYPGWGYGHSSALTENERGAGLGGGLSVGASINPFVNPLNGPGGGGWHSRSGSSCRALVCTDAAAKGEPTHYSDAGEMIISINQPYIGSGGGGSSELIDPIRYFMTGGSGGGALKLTANKLEIVGFSAFDFIGADSTAGFVGYYPESAPRNKYHAYGAAGKIVIKVGEISITANTPANLPISAKSEQTEEISWSDPNFCSKISGGSGGYVTIVYSKSAQSYDTIKSKIDVHTICQQDSGISATGAEKGVIALVNKTEADQGIAIKKWLEARDRPGQGGDFNPYALQVGDTIYVHLRVEQLTPGLSVKITDELLKSSSGEKCLPTAYANPAGVREGDTYVWQRTPVQASEEFVYECKVQ
ncbi:MAG: hypothetical protein AAB360_01825 [Patescibacteria group bacterium]